MTTYRLHQKFWISTSTAMADISTVRARLLNITAAKLLPGQVTANPSWSSGGAGHSGGEVDRFIHI